MARNIPDMKNFAAAWWLMTVFAVVLAGCATNKINWAARVGNYTLDQAITELGPPDKQAKLTDGTVVAEWLTSRGRSSFYATGAGFYGYPGWPGYYGGYLQPGAPDYFLRLTFRPDGKLAAWKKFAR